MGRQHSMKGSAPSQGGTLNSRYIKQGHAAPGDSAAGSPSINNGGQGLGGGTLNSRHSTVKPSSSAAGQIGPAQPLRNAPAFDPNGRTSTLGKSVVKSTKPRK